MKIKTKKEVWLLFILIANITIIYLGELNYDNKVAKNAELFKSAYIKLEKVTSDMAKVNELNKSEATWIDRAIKKQTFENANLSEAEFIVLLLKTYNIKPLNTASVFWAEGYYLKLANYNYSLSESDDREKPITFVHAAEIISSMQGERNSGENALRFLLENNIYKEKNLLRQNNLVTRKEAVKLVNQIKKLGFAEFQYLPTNEPEDKGTLVALGDSISLGWNIKWSRASELSFPYLIGKKYSYHVYNLAATGLTSNQLLQKLNEPLYSHKIKNAKVITLDIGSVDLLHGSEKLYSNAKKGKLSIPSYTEVKKINDAVNNLESNIEKILKVIKATTDVPIFIYGFYNPIPENSIPFTFADSIISDLNKNIEKITARSKNVYFLDSRNAINNNQEKYLISGDIHPSVEGQKVLFELADKAIRQQNINFEEP